MSYISFIDFILQILILEIMIFYNFNHWSQLLCQCLFPLSNLVQLSNGFYIVLVYPYFMLSYKITFTFQLFCNFYKDLPPIFMTSFSYINTQFNNQLNMSPALLEILISYPCHSSRPDQFHFFFYPVQVSVHLVHFSLPLNRINFGLKNLLFFFFF